MNEPSFPNIPSSAPAHEAPERRWVPMSGWAVTAFVLSLIGIVVGLFWTWWPLGVPLAIGVGVIVLVPAGTRRGRVLAVWSIVISLLAGSCSFMLHTQAKALFSQMGGDVLSALASKGDGAAASARDDALRRWIAPSAIEAGILGRIKARYAIVEGEVGPYAGSVDAGTVFDGATALFLPPIGVAEIDPPEKEGGLMLGQTGAIWMRARFRDAELWLALVVQDAGNEGLSLTGMDPGAGTLPVVLDVRFFHTAKPAGTAAPPSAD